MCPAPEPPPRPPAPPPAAALARRSGAVLESAAMKKLALAFANGFGLGLAPFASGTFGALVGIPFAIAITAIPSVWFQAAAALALALLAIPVCEAGEIRYGEKDPGRVVADEWMLLPICFVGQVPVWDLLVAGDYARAAGFVALAFAASRFFDILKPFPAYRLQALHGGFGIVFDDFFADLYAWVAIRLLSLWLFADLVIR